jgi:hypothetical protein
MSGFYKVFSLRALSCFACGGRPSARRQRASVGNPRRHTGQTDGMQSVTLGYDEGGSLTLANPKRGESGELWWITATVEQDGVRASTQVESHYAARDTIVLSCHFRATTDENLAVLGERRRYSTDPLPALTRKRPRVQAAFSQFASRGRGFESHRLHPVVSTRRRCRGRDQRGAGVLGPIFASSRKASPGSTDPLWACLAGITRGR